MTTTVVGVDGSPDSDLAVEWAAQDAARRHRPLHIVHAYLGSLVAAQLAAPSSAEYGAALRAVAEGALDAAVARARAVAAELDITTDMPVGEAPAALLDAARHAALLVVGNRGLGGFSGLLVGSVGAELAAHAPVPVIIARRSTRVSGPEAGRVVVAVDVGHDPQRALAFAFEQAASRGVGVTAMHTQRWPGHTDPQEILPVVYDDGVLRERSRRALSEAVDGWSARCPGVAVRTVFVHSRTGMAVVNESAGAALFVVGSRGHAAMTGLLPGSVSQAAVHHAPCPVAIVK